MKIKTVKNNLLRFNGYFLLSLFITTFSFADDPCGGYFADYELKCPKYNKKHDGMWAEASVIPCNIETLEVDNIELNKLLEELKKHGNPKQKAILDEMHAAWEALKIAQSALVRTYYEGVTYEKWTTGSEVAMTQARIKELKQLREVILHKKDGLKTNIQHEGVAFSYDKQALKNDTLKLNAQFDRLMKYATKEQQLILKDMQTAWRNLKKAQSELIGAYSNNIDYLENMYAYDTDMTRKRLEALNQLGQGILWQARDTEEENK
ncbi:MAG: hypothetical protein PUP46_07235 [Endozoicomonas sp. (ex Botrylloides leachii)]|nr:hypothetical protein [Endozoicomonas sp. (ex Botrylloides leachii)]